MIFLFYTTVNLLLLPCKQPFLAVVVNRKTKTIKVDTRGTLILKYGNSQRDLKSVRATTWRKIQKALKWTGSNLQNLVNFIALKGKKKKIKCWEMFTSCWLGRVVLTAFLVLQNYESKEIGCIKPYLTCSTNMFPFLPQAAPLGFTSFRRFKIYQPEELLVLNISPLMEVSFWLLPTVIGDNLQYKTGSMIYKMNEQNWKI